MEACPVLGNAMPDIGIGRRSPQSELESNHKAWRICYGLVAVSLSGLGSTAARTLNGEPGDFACSMMHPIPSGAIHRLTTIP